MISNRETGSIPVTHLFIFLGGIMPEIFEFYRNNSDFKMYVDKYSRKHRMLPETALSHRLIFEAYLYYKGNTSRQLPTI